MANDPSTFPVASLTRQPPNDDLLRQLYYAYESTGIRGASRIIAETRHTVLLEVVRVQNNGQRDHAIMFYPKLEGIPLDLQMLWEALKRYARQDTHNNSIVTGHLSKIDNMKVNMLTENISVDKAQNHYVLGMRLNNFNECDRAIGYSESSLQLLGKPLPGDIEYRTVGGNEPLIAMTLLGETQPVGFPQTKDNTPRIIGSCNHEVLVPVQEHTAAMVALDEASLQDDNNLHVVSNQGRADLLSPDSREWDDTYSKLNGYLGDGVWAAKKILVAFPNSCLMVWDGINPVIERPWQASWASNCALAKTLIDEYNSIQFLPTVNYLNEFPAGEDVSNVYMLGEMNDGTVLLRWEGDSIRSHMGREVYGGWIHKSKVASSVLATWISTEKATGTGKGALYASFDDHTQMDPAESPLTRAFTKIGATSAYMLPPALEVLVDCEKADFTFDKDAVNQGEQRILYEKDRFSMDITDYDPREPDHELQEIIERSRHYTEDDGYLGNGVWAVSHIKYETETEYLFSWRGRDPATGKRWPRSWRRKTSILPAEVLENWKTNPKTPVHPNPSPTSEARFFFIIAEVDEDEYVVEWWSMRARFGWERCGGLLRMEQTPADVIALWENSREVAADVTQHVEPLKTLGPHHIVTPSVKTDTATDPLQTVFSPIADHLKRIRGCTLITTPDDKERGSRMIQELSKIDQFIKHELKNNHDEDSLWNYLGANHFPRQVDGQLLRKIFERSEELKVEEKAKGLWSKEEQGAEYNDDVLPAIVRPQKRKAEDADSSDVTTKHKTACKSSPASKGSSDT